MKKVLSLIMALVLAMFAFACTAETTQPAEATAAQAETEATQAAATEAPATDFPKHNITVICPWGAGGGTDSLLRALCSAAEPELGVSLVVSNVTGGGGATGHAAIKEATADGYTVGMITYELTTLSAQGLIPFTYDDIDPILCVNMDAAIIAVPADAPYSTADEFVAYAKEHPGEINIANPAVGGSWNIAAATFAQKAGIEVKHVPFEGTAEAVTAAVGGHVQAVVASIPEVQAQVLAGQLKVIGVMAAERSDALPDAPTFMEQGYDLVAGTWRGLALPKGVPDAERQILIDAFTNAMSDPDFLEFAGNLGLGIYYQNADDFKQNIADTAENAALALKELGLID